jgi:hypothetical protein
VRNCDPSSLPVVLASDCIFVYVMACVFVEMGIGIIVFFFFFLDLVSRCTFFWVCGFVWFLQNSLEKLNFSKVVSCQKQVVAGILYHLVIEVEEGSKPKQYEAKVWVKPGGAPKKLEEFKPKDGGLTSADLGVKSTG